MIILKAIGAFFVKIWRWIKDTAWVQPLLIVGAIFAIIFSIPYITSWANSWSGNSTNSFYNASKKTLEGEEESTSGGSEADKLTQTLYGNSLLSDTTKIDEKYGKKFFVIFANSTNSSSNEAETGFKYLRDYWNTQGINSSDTLPFTYYTIFSDDTSSTDDSLDKNLGNAWERYLKNNIDFFNTSITKLTSAPYYANNSMSEDNYANFALSDLSSDKKASSAFPIPTFCLIDYSDTAIKAGRWGLSEILFTLSGETDGAKAKLLMNMWNHCDSDTTNIFSSSYIK